MVFALGRFLYLRICFIGKASYVFGQWIRTDSTPREAAPKRPISREKNRESIGRGGLIVIYFTDGRCCLLSSDSNA